MHWLSSSYFREATPVQVAGDPGLSEMTVKTPSTKAASLTQTTLGCTSQVEEKLAKPQSAPARRRSARCG
jgi:hypothetical protein